MTRLEAINELERIWNEMRKWEGWDTFSGLAAHHMRLSIDALKHKQRIAEERTSTTFVGPLTQQKWNEYYVIDCTKP